ncbi:NAD(P)/FAD-dependent oxidoreductase [Foetidibacter luteolus]|uniref:NAD(P)/FAD-dependent oxidoreductase n=1 Tax=Foetidibacter luteolus TaxID=2608880 RepID=UPI00129B3B3F|nr:NAD(P)/FAD-dependent oxidoreductase [Foetidibacter luteolus]
MKVVVVGGGFAGINLAKSLAGNTDIEVVLVDKNNYHFFPPLIYQVSTAFIEPSNISYPFRRMFQHKHNLRFYMGRLKSIVPAENKIITASGELTYDYLVLCMGTETNYFGMENVKKNALPMKTIDDALNLRNHILLNVEKAIRTNDPVEKYKHLNIVIAGGGPTGVEISGMLAEMARNIVSKDYPEIKAGNIRTLYLVDAGHALLGPMSKKAQDEAYRVLHNLGVQIKLGSPVKDYKDDTVYLANGETIPSHTLIWASGVIAREAPGLPAEVIGRGRRIMVDEYNRVQGIPNIFAIGDICLQTTDKNFPGGHPQLAQVAIQQGKLVAKNLVSLHAGKPLKAFSYNNKGSMAIISKFKAVVDLPKGFFKGFAAWLVWLFIHLIPIAGYRNKAKLAYNWFWSFITNDPTLRLIIRPKKKAVAGVSEQVEKTKSPAAAPVAQG